jgi:hypothetical protein
MRPALSFRSLGIVAIVTATNACTSTYYRTLETFGIEKRDILVDRIEDARDTQESAKEQFASALDQYRSVVAFDGGNLERVYNRLNREYERSRDRADAVGNRIESVQTVAEDLFDEWAEEIEEYSDPSLASESRRLLSETRSSYRNVIEAMRRAERTMSPVLTLFNDQVLVLRHNLNARAIGSLEGELTAIERATSELITEMEAAIAEASRFIDAMA